MSKLFTLLYLLLVSQLCFAQDWNYYQPLKAIGEVPKDFTEAYTAKYKNKSKVDSTYSSRKDRIRHIEFLKRSEFFTDEFLTSGKVFYGDPVTNYCQSIVDKLVGDDEKLKNSIRVYTVKSLLTNAAATANGIIFVNLGLIAQLETEAQLAFILSHELIHFTNHDVMDQYIEEDNLKNVEDFPMNKSDQQKRLSNYSRSQESEADKQGFEKFFKKSGYSKYAPFEVLEIMQYSYLPFDEEVFNKSIFESGNYRIPISFLLEQTSSIKAVDDYDDENSTHPNLLKRKQQLDQIIQGRSGSDFLISNSIFNHCRKLARFELSRLHLNNQNYIQALYNSYLLLSNNPNNRYLRLSIAKALHGLTVYEGKGNLSLVLPPYEEIEGASQQLYYLLDQLGEGELATLNLNYCYRLKKDFPNDKTIEKYYQNALKSLVFANELKLNDFYKVDRDSVILKSEIKKDSILKSRRSHTKFMNIKTKKIDNQISGINNYWRYAFVDFLGDQQFVADFKRVELDYAKFVKSDIYEIEELSFYQSRFERNLSLGLDTILFINPSYLILNHRANEGISFTKSKKNNIEYKSYIEECSQMLGINSIILDYKNSAFINNRTFNNLAILQSWTEERMNLGQNEIIVSDAEFVEPIIDQIGGRYIVKTGNLIFKGKKNLRGRIFAAAVVFPLAPIIIADMFKPKYDSYNYFYLFDIKTGKALITQFNRYKTKDSGDYVKSMVYNHLLQIKN